jgi:hypothetical protein
MLSAWSVTADGLLSKSGSLPGTLNSRATSDFESAFVHFLTLKTADCAGRIPRLGVHRSIFEQIPRKPILSGNLSFRLSPCNPATLW